MLDPWCAFFHPPKIGARLFDLPAENPRLGLELFRPTVLVERRIPRMRKVQRIQRPLFAGLGFCSAGSLDPLTELVERKLDATIRPLLHGGHVSLFPRSELATMMAAAQVGASAEDELRVGDQVQIAFGPLAGSLCVIRRVLRKRFEVDVSVAAASAFRVRIDPCLLARIER